MAPILRVPRVVRHARRGPDDRDRRLAHHGWFHHWRTNRMLAYRGLLAFDFLNLAAAHPGVLSITERPRPIQWWDGRRWAAYRPRYELTVAPRMPGVARRVDVEVVTSIELAADRLMWHRLRAEFRDASRPFLLLTEQTIRAEPRLTNARLILTQAGDGLVSHEDLTLVRQVAAGTATFTLNELVAVGVLTYPRAYAAALNLVARGELSFGLSRRFDGATPIHGRS